MTTCGNVAWMEAIRCRNQNRAMPAPSAMTDMASGQVNPCHRAKPWLAWPSGSVSAYGLMSFVRSGPQKPSTRLITPSAMGTAAIPNAGRCQLSTGAPSLEANAPHHHRRE